MESILLLEENAAFARVITAKLHNEAGCHTLVAATLAEARGLLESGAKDIIMAVSGFSTPGSPDGAAVDYLLGKKIPTIVLCDKYDETIRQRLADKPVVDLLLKRTTDDLNVLATAVRRVLGNRGLKILLVDDAAPYRVAMREMLESQLYTVYEAADGQEGLNQLEKQPDVKIIVTDYYMPVMDGFEFVTRVRKKHTREKLAIIVLSGAREEDVAAKFLKFGANDFIKKPFSSEEFNWRINLNADHLELMEQLRRTANTDYLTGLLNRRAFYAAAGRLFTEAAAHGQELAVAMLDIDHFKKVNDTHGHDAGDVAIKDLAALLTMHLPAADAIARFGGEEFCVLARGKDAAAVEEMFESARKAVEAATTRCGDAAFRFTVSIGVCMKPLATLEDTITRADALLYEAKNGGRNRVCSG